MSEIAIPEVVLEDQLAETPTQVPAISTVSLDRLDGAVTQIEQAALKYTCQSEQDYIDGGKAVERIRSLDKLFENTFKPIKDWWTARLAEARTDESSRRGKLELSKKAISSAMLTWKVKRDAEIEEQRKAEEALAKKRAEDELLARAEAVGDVAVLDEPLAMAPTYARASVPKLKSSTGGRGVTMVKQLCVVGAKKYTALLQGAQKEKRLLNDKEWEAAQVIDGDDLDDLILTIACSRIAYEMDVPKGVKDWAWKLASRAAQREFLEAVPKVLRDTARAKEAFFNVNGVMVVHKERLG